MYVIYRPRRSRPDDRGAVATVFAMLLAGGVLLGVMALVVDVGQIYVERDELQSGADAAALGVAKACATRTVECASPAGVIAVAQRYANANASDGVSQVAEVCGRLPGVLPDCDPPAQNLTACLGSPPSDLYVEVRLSTRLPDGRLVLPPVFAQSMSQGFDGVSVGACARAGWRLRLDVPLLGIAMSTCDFNAADIGDSVVLGDASRCNGDLVGAVIDGADSRCVITLPDDATVGGHVLTDVRFPIGTDCKTRLHEAISNGQIVYLPVYDRVGGDTLNPTFRVVGAAGVIVTGYVDRTDSAPPADTGPPTTDRRCNGAQDRCISMRVVEKIGPFSLIGDSTVDLIG